MSYPIPARPSPSDRTRRVVAEICARPRHRDRGRGAGREGRTDERAQSAAPYAHVVRSRRLALLPSCALQVRAHCRQIGPGMPGLRGIQMGAQGLRDLGRRQYPSQRLIEALSGRVRVPLDSLMMRPPASQPGCPIPRLSTSR